jgi:hypothetical protein
MYKYSYVLVFLICLSSCAQQTKEPQNTTPTTMDIRAILEDDPYIDQLQKYDYGPEYVIRVESLYAYEIRVDDIPVANNFSDMGGTIWYPINQAILSSGEQIISIHVYPRYSADGIQREYFEDPEEYDFKLWIEQSAWVDGGKEEPKIVLYYELPKEDENGKEIDFSQLRSHHKELTFTATVPYTLTGWSESKVFKQKDSVALEKRVVAFYEHYRQLMVDKKPVELEFLGLKQAYETSQYTYLTDKAQLFKDRKEYVRDFPNEEFFMRPLKDYKMVYYGNGRVVGLILDKNPVKGESAIAKKHLNERGERRTSFYSLLLHQPKGSDSLEIIR